MKEQTSILGDGFLSKETANDTKYFVFYSRNLKYRKVLRREEK